MSSPYAPVHAPAFNYREKAVTQEDHESTLYRYIYWALGVLVALMLLSVWQWNRGADVRLQIAPAGSTVTFDGQPLTVNNGEAVLTHVSRGGHTLVVNSPEGTSVAHVMDVGFFTSTQTESITAPAPLIAMHKAAASPVHRRHK